MKKILGFTALAAFTILYSGCSDDSSDSAPPSSTGGTMTAKVDGNNWTALSNRAAASIVSNTSNATGVASDSSVITLTVTENVVNGQSYDLSATGEGVGVFNSSTDGSTVSWTSNAGCPDCGGTLTITSMDTTNKKISGTFNFKAYRFTDNTLRTITQGVFTNLTYATSVSGTGTNTFTVKIDGVTFTPALLVGTTSLGNINITASDNQGVKSVGLVMPETVTPGTYSMAAFGTYYGTYNASAGNYTICDTGTLTITSHNTTTQKVVGTFSFVSEPLTGGPPTYNLTNGSFSVSY